MTYQVDAHYQPMADEEIQPALQRQSGHFGYGAMCRLVATLLVRDARIEQLERKYAEACAQRVAAPDPAAQG